MIAALGDFVRALFQWRAPAEDVPTTIAPVEVTQPKPAISVEAFAAAAVVADPAKLKALNAACARYAITTPMRAAMFLAQVSHESGGFVYTHELWGPTPTSAQERYEPPSDLAARLGNFERGDGYRYRGRGFIQLTGRANYRKAGDALGFNYEDDPDMVARPIHAAAVAGWYWDTHNCNQLADKGDFVAITKAINGGVNGLPDRVRRLSAIATAMGLSLNGVRLS